MVFRYNDVSGISSLDPAFARNNSVIWAVHQLYNTLVETDPELHFKPSLAKKWTISEDRLTYTFTLRNDVWFHDNDAFPRGKGRKMTAHDVVYSLKRIIDPATASSGAWIFSGKLDEAAPFTAIDDTTFQLKLRTPYSPILGILSMKYCSVVPFEVVEKYGKDFRNHPCGTGPFLFKFWVEGQALVMHKNPNYFEKDSSGNSIPYLDAIMVSFLDSKAAEFLAFRQGRLSFINDIDASFKDEILTKNGLLRTEWEGRIKLQKHPYLNIEYLGILTDSTNEIVKQSPLRLKKIRQAINFGFNRKKLMLYLRNSVGIPAESGFVPAGLPSFDTTKVRGYSYKPEKARQLLAEAGFPEGKNLPAIRLLTVPAYADLASFIANELQQIGINIQVEALQRSLLLDLTATSKALFFRGSWIADYPDPENYLSVFYSKNPSPPNYTRYNNPEFDRLFELALNEENDSLRTSIYQRMDQMVIDDAPVVPLWYDEVLRLVQPDIEGFQPNPLNILELRRTRVKNGKQH
ncbi:MAG TPA: ABC transporter substrate-binding protein [Parasegetibacter sp.]